MQKKRNFARAFKYRENRQKRLSRRLYNGVMLTVPGGRSETVRDRPNKEYKVE